MRFKAEFLAPRNFQITSMSHCVNRVLSMLRIASFVTYAARSFTSCCCESTVQLCCQFNLVIYGVSMFSIAHLTPAAGARAAGSGCCIVALGDSTTVGYSVIDGYPRKLARQLFENGISAAVINSGVNGDTTAGARERFERDVLSHDPDVVIIQFGLNDQTVRLYQRPEDVKSYVTETQFASNLRYFISELRRREVKIVLMTPNPMCWTPVLERHYPEGPFLKGPRGGNSLLQKYVDTERQLAESQKVPLVDVFQGYFNYEKTSGRPITNLFLDDGVHPNEAGYELNAKLLWDQLRPLVKTEKSDSFGHRMRPFSIVRDGKLVSAYIVGQGCRGCEGYFELARTERECNPQEYLSAPVALGKNDWVARLEITAGANSEWSIHIGDSGRITCSVMSGRIVVGGPIFNGTATDQFTTHQVCSGGEMKLELSCKDRRLRLRVDGQDVFAINIVPTDLGPVRIEPNVGAVQVKNFYAL
jgi:lysophospholipase L1-like esterase